MLQEPGNISIGRGNSIVVQSSDSESMSEDMPEFRSRRRHLKEESDSDVESQGILINAYLKTCLEKVPVGKTMMKHDLYFSQATG